MRRRIIDTVNYKTYGVPKFTFLFFCMELTTFVFQAACIVYLAAGVGALLGNMKFESLVKDFEKSPGLTYLAGFITVIIGLLIVGQHNVWQKDWTVLVTIIGWAALIKGVFLIAFPNQLSMFNGLYKKNSMWGVLLIILGVLFGYLGFYM